MTENTPKLAVSVALRHADSGAFLLVKRGKHPSKGMWAFAGGRVEFGETLKQAARRELLEETGLRADALKLFDTIELIQTDDRPDRPAHHYVLHVHAGVGRDVPEAGDDADDARWVHLSEFAELPVTKSTFEFAKRIAHSIPLGST